jgi:hypothetical protein
VHHHLKRVHSYPIGHGGAIWRRSVLFFRNREPRAQLTVCSAVDGAMFRLYISTVHMTRGCRAKRASGGLRRARTPVQLCGGTRSISAWPGRHIMAPASLRITQSRALPPWSRREQGPCPDRVACPRNTPRPVLRALPPRHCGDPTHVISRSLGCPSKPESHTHIAPWEMRHRDLRKCRTHDL